MKVTTKQKKELIKVLHDFEEREQLEVIHNSIDDLEDEIHIAHTTYGDEQYELQCNYNIEELCWKEYINGELKNVVKHSSLDDFIAEISSSSFDDIVRQIYRIALYMEKECEGNRVSVKE